MPAMPAAIAAAFLIAAAAAGFLARQHWQGNDNQPPTAQPVAEPRIDFTLPDLQGSPRSLAEWRGEALLVNFWATWCAPCRREIPLLKRTQEAQHGKGLQVVGIAVDYREDVLAYAETAAFNYPILVGQEEAMAAAESSGLPFRGLPFTMLIAADGRLIKTHIGEIFEPQLERIVTVVGRLNAGEIDLAGAREALGRL